MTPLSAGSGGAWRNFPDWPRTDLDGAIAGEILPDCLLASRRGIFRPDGTALIRRDTLEKRLIVYGTLAPGKENAAQLEGIEGRWRRVLVPGKIDRSGRYPFFHPGGVLQPARLFESDMLAGRLPALDRFEGPEYRRIAWPVLDPDEGWLIAQIYAATLPPPL